MEDNRRRGKQLSEVTRGYEKLLKGRDKDKDKS